MDELPGNDGQDNRCLNELIRGTAPDAVVGIIASVTRAFRGSGDRVRLTADGQLRNCLFATGEFNLRALRRGGADDAAIKHAWSVSVAGKGPGHTINSTEFRRPERPMSAIGG